MKFDVIVVGLGIMGASALSTLARAGANVLGLDQFAPPHDRGSSHGETRLLRVAYAEGPAYVPMAQRSIELWRGLEKRTGENLFEQTGVAYFGDPNAQWLIGLQESARRYSIALEQAQAPQIDVPKDWLKIFEPDAGFLRAEHSVAAFLKDARRHGAKVITRARFVGLEQDGKSIRVRTSRGSFSARRVVLCVGVWSRRHLPFLRKLRLEQRVLHWHEADNRFDLADGFRPFVISPSDDVVLYGNSRVGGAVKLAQHHFGMPIRDPSLVGRQIDDSEFAHVGELVRRYIPALGPRIRSKACMYMLTPDEHFILDRHPAMHEVYFLAGLSGHGFKFAPVLGEALANYALGRRQEIDVKFFSLKRF